MRVDDVDEVGEKVVIEVASTTTAMISNRVSTRENCRPRRKKTPWFVFSIFLVVLWDPEGTPRGT